MAQTYTAVETASGEAFGIPGYRVGTWDIDPVHSDVSFSARHMMVSKVKGNFSRFEGSFVTAENPLDSKVSATVDLSSLDTRNVDRDTHVRSADFLDVENYPALTFTSTGLRRDGEGFVLEGDLSVHGVTRKVELELEINGFSPDPFGGYRSGFTATTEISRSDYGISLSMPMDGGGVVVSDKIHISLEIEAILRAEDAS